MDLAEGKVVMWNSKQTVGVPRCLVSSGRHLPTETLEDSGRLLIVNPTTLCECPDGDIGEIWVCGKSKTGGYWNNADATLATFEAEIKKTETKESAEWVTKYPKFLRTGDLGFWNNGDLYVTGRKKEMIIANGKNYYPEGIEGSVIGAHPSIRPGSITAFAVEHPEAEFKEQLAIMLEVSDPKKAKRISGDTRLAKILLRIVGATSYIPGLQASLRAGKNIKNRILGDSSQTKALEIAKGLFFSFFFCFFLFSDLSFFSPQPMRIQNWILHVRFEVQY